VTAAAVDDLDELDAKMDAVRERMEEWAGDLRTIQPETYPATREDQSILGEGST
jgi:hypothetical protein